MTNWKKAAALLLALAMAIGLSPAALAGDDATPFDNVTVTAKWYHAYNEGAEDYPDSDIGQLIRQKFGISLLIYPTSSTGTEDMIRDFATDDAPDIINCYAIPDQGPVLIKAGSEGQLKDLVPYWDSYPATKHAMTTDQVPLNTRVAMNDAGFGEARYMIPYSYSPGDPWPSGWGLYIRGDVAEALGIGTPEPTLNTADDLYEMLVAIKEAELVDTLGRPLYPLGMIASWPHCVAAPIRPFDFGGPQKLGLSEDGKIEHIVTTHWAMDQIGFYRKLIAEGLFDPEGLTQSYETGCEKLAQGRYAITPCFAMMSLPTVWRNYMETLVKDNPEMEYQTLGSNYFTSQGDDAQYLNKGTEVGLVMALSKNANADAVLTLIEWGSTLEGKATLGIGIEGRDWFWNDAGFAEEVDEYFQLAVVDTRPLIEKEWAGRPLRLVGAGSFSAFSGMYGKGVPDAFGNLNDTKYYQNDNTNDMLVNARVEKMMGNMKVENKFTLDTLIRSYEGREQIEPVLAEWMDVFYQCVLAKTDDDAESILNSYVNTLKSNGFDAYMDYVNEVYSANPDLYATYLTEVQ